MSEPMSRAADPWPDQLWTPDRRAAEFPKECRRQSELIRESESAASRAEDEAWEAASWQTLSREAR